MSSCNLPVSPRLDTKPLKRAPVTVLDDTHSAIKVPRPSSVNQPRFAALPLEIRNLVKNVYRLTLREELAALDDAEIERTLLQLYYPAERVCYDSFIDAFPDLEDAMIKHRRQVLAELFRHEAGKGWVTFYFPSEEAFEGDTKTYFRESLAAWVKQGEVAVSGNPKLAAFFEHAYNKLGLPPSYVEVAPSPFVETLIRALNDQLGPDDFAVPPPYAVPYTVNGRQYWVRMAGLVTPTREKMLINCMRPMPSCLHAYWSGYQPGWKPITHHFAPEGEAHFFRWFEKKNGSVTRNAIAAHSLRGPEVWYKLRWEISSQPILKEDSIYHEIAHDISRILGGGGQYFFRSQVKVPLETYRNWLKEKVALLGPYDTHFKHHFVNFRALNDSDIEEFWGECFEAYWVNRKLLRDRTPEMARLIDAIMAFLHTRDVLTPKDIRHVQNLVEEYLAIPKEVVVEERVLIARKAKKSKLDHTTTLILIAVALRMIMLLGHSYPYLGTTLRACLPWYRGK